MLFKKIAEGFPFGGFASAIVLVAVLVLLVILVLILILVLVVILILVLVVHFCFLLIYLFGIALCSIPLISGFILWAKYQTYKQADNNCSCNTTCACFQSTGKYTNKSVFRN